MENKVRLPIAKPLLPEVKEMWSDLVKCFRSGIVTNGENVMIFEREIAETIGTKEAVAVSSATTGLMLLLRCLGLKGEVILPSFTFFATGHAVIWNNLIPIFVDSNPETFNLEPENVEKAITRKTCAILGVHVFGNPCDVEELEEIARRNNIKLIFDSAHGMGASYNSKLLGSFGNGEVFSLSPTKLVVAGEGGVVTTNDKSLAMKLRAARDYGNSGDYNPKIIGMNGRMSELHAILGRKSLRLLREQVKMRNIIAKHYRERLSHIPGIFFQRVKEGNVSSFKDFTILVDEKKFGMSRDKLAQELNKEGIATKKYYYPPLHRINSYKNYITNMNGKLPITERLSSQALSLPIFSEMKKVEVERVCNIFERITRKRRDAK